MNQVKAGGRNSGLIADDVHAVARVKPSSAAFFTASTQGLVTRRCAVSV